MCPHSLMQMIIQIGIVYACFEIGISEATPEQWSAYENTKDVVTRIVQVLSENTHGVTGGTQ